MSVERCGHGECDDIMNRSEYCPQAAVQPDGVAVTLVDLIDGMLGDDELVPDQKLFRHDGGVSTSYKQFSFIQPNGSQGPVLRRTVKLGFETKSEPNHSNYEVIDGWSLYDGEEGTIQAETVYSLAVYPAGVAQAGLEYICSLPGAEPEARPITQFDCDTAAHALKDVIKYCTRPPASHDSNLA